MSPATGSSWLHRSRAGIKLAALAGSVAAVVLLPSPAAVALAALATLGLYRSAGIGPPGAWRQVQPLRWIVLILLTFQTLTAGWETGVLVVGKLLITVALAGLLTLTTPMTELLDVVERLLRPLRLVGGNPERAALVLALAIRAVPVVGGFAAQVRDAQRARGLHASIRAYAVPLVVRSLQHADQLGEALVARGFDD
ncbi:MAG TPA: energy-coupling factor transporter transmembrane protein EcfT [Jiangellaceae bacterium]|nr:energy-coupling factor transporter transmembrane protein EcfT [Jiangellaceae bacterium]